MRATSPSTRLRFAAGVGALLVARAALGEYSWEISGLRQSLSMGEGIDGDLSALSATRYFRPVRENLGPAALAEFLSPTSSLSISGHRDEQVQGYAFGLPGTTTTIKEVAEGVGLSGRHVWRESGWYAGGAVQTADIDNPLSTSPPQTDFRSYRALGGKYLGDRTSVELSLRTSLTATDYPWSFVCAQLQGCIGRTEVETEEIAVSAVHVGTVRSLTYSISGSFATRESALDFSLAQPPVTSTLPPFRPVTPVGGGRVAVIPVPLPSQQDFAFRDIDTYTVAGEFFPTSRLSARIGYTRRTDDPLRERSYDLAATWFALPHLGLKVAFSRASSDTPLSLGLDDLDTVTLQIVGRL